MRLTDEQKSVDPGRRSPLIYKGPIFRGQSSSSNRLESTLIRSHGEMDVHKYYDNVIKTLHVFESEFNEIVDRPIDLDQCRDAAALESMLGENNSLKKYRLPLLGYLARLRHFGCPSPLLDWSRSPYVAAYFAYRNSSNSRNGNIGNASNREYGDSRVAIYMHIDSIGIAKASAENVGQIIRVLLDERTSPRHNAQQSEYTICLKRATRGGSSPFKYYRFISEDQFLLVLQRFPWVS